MKQRKIMIGVAVLAALGFGVVLIQFHPQSLEEPAREVSKAVKETVTPPVPKAGLASSQTPAPSTSVAHPPVQDLPDTLRVEDFRSATVRADQELATVNGKPVHLNDLLPVAPDENEKTMTAEQYESRLKRAIEMELTFQAAKAQAVELTREQQRRLNKIARDHQATFSKYQQEGISWSSVTASQLEFEKRLISALMLQQNLVAKEAGVAPSPDPVIQTRYEQALGDMFARIKATANITVGNAAL